MVRLVYNGKEIRDDIGRLCDLSSFRKPFRLLCLLRGSVQNNIRKGILSGIRSLLRKNSNSDSERWREHYKNIHMLRGQHTQSKLESLTSPDPNSSDVPARAESGTSEEEVHGTINETEAEDDSAESPNLMVDLEQQQLAPAAGDTDNDGDDTSDLHSPSSAVIVYGPLPQHEP